MHILVTMAGLGSRFRAKGFLIPKYQIVVRGRTLFSWSMESLRNLFPNNVATFVVHKEDDPTVFLHRELEKFGVENPNLVCLDHMTDGQATTVLLALPKLRQLDSRASLLIYNIDTYVESRCLNPADIRGDGWIPCFPGIGDAWSFFRCASEGRVLEAREKVRISEHASIGMYYFNSLDLFEETYHTFFSNGLPEELRERYVAPMYQQMISEGREVWVHPIPADAVHPLGTPEEVEAFAHDA